MPPIFSSNNKFFVNFVTLGFIPIPNSPTYDAFSSVASICFRKSSFFDAELSITFPSLNFR